MLALADPRSGRWPLSQVAGAKPCTPPTIAWFCRLPNEVTYFLCGSSGLRMGLSLKSAPAPLGVHLSISAPCDVLPMMAPCGM